MPSLPSLPPFLSSLRARLALWYLLVLGLALAAFAAGIFLEVRQSLLVGVDQTLRARAVAVAGQVRIGADGVAYQGVDVPRAGTEIALYLFDARGQLRDQIAGSPDLPPRPAALGPTLRGRERAVTMGELRLYMA